MRGLSLILAFGCLPLVRAQTPDVRVKFDLTYDYRIGEETRTAGRLYSTLGRHSILGLIFYLEPGFRGYVSQKLQRVSNRNDPSGLDEIYVEDEGIWRLGRQYLPFGTGNLLRESAGAARADTNLIFEGLPLALALVDGGPGWQRGIVARVGSRLGFSFAFGKRFGSSATALTYVRRPEDAPGRERGWGRAFGVDYSKRAGVVTVRAEALALVDGETADDRDTTILDLNASLNPNPDRSVSLGWTHRSDSRDSFVRLQGAFRVSREAFFEPLVRYRSGEFYDLSFALRVRF